MDFRQIEAFVAVIKYKSFSKAADILFLTQPTISAHINSLERELGLPLIDRSYREAVPTKQGKVLFQYALDMLNTREKAIKSMKPSVNDMDCVLEIQTSSVPGEYLLPALLAAFKREHPLIRFFVEQSDSASVITSIADNKSEIGFTGNKADSSLEYIPVFKDKLVLITPKTDRFLSIGNRPIKIEEIIDEPFIYREQGSGTIKDLEDSLGKIGYGGRKLNIAAKMNSMQAIKQAVSCNMGISMISEIAAEGREDKGYLTFELENLSLMRYFYLVHSKKVALSPAVETFKEFVLGYFKDEISSHEE
ncbi:selenium metabolism-associated LysR family transcriptional regulator [Alloiococcus sp. CFN-8]|uniref:selenium metabolism-associated LysR family transcriptional regulator n=1 Tax=Alloiococcus sp. CFN-8 TaxID=3416081 RepID=UPI003CE80803